jgi:hypothetical protein
MTNLTKIARRIASRTALPMKRTNLPDSADYREFFESFAPDLNYFRTEVSEITETRGDPRQKIYTPRFGDVMSLGNLRVLWDNLVADSTAKDPEVGAKIAKERDAFFQMADESSINVLETFPISFRKAKIPVFLSPKWLAHDAVGHSSIKSTPKIPLDLFEIRVLRPDVVRARAIKVSAPIEEAFADSFLPQFVLREIFLASIDPKTLPESLQGAAFSHVRQTGQVDDLTADLGILIVQPQSDLSKVRFDAPEIFVGEKSQDNISLKSFPDAIATVQIARGKEAVAKSLFLEIVADLSKEFSSTQASRLLGKVVII